MKDKHRHPEPSTVGLIAHYKLWAGPTSPGKVFDYSLGGFEGSLTGTDIHVAYPGLEFNGTDDHIIVDDNIAFSPILSPLTVSAWINMTDATNFPVIGKFVAGATTREWLLSVQASDFLLFQVFDETADAVVARFFNSALASFQGDWIHVAGVYDGGTADSSIKVYLNGTQVDDTNIGSGVFVSCRDTAAVVDIGKEDLNFADGKIGEVRVYNTELAAIEIKSLFDLTKWRYPNN